MKTKFHKTSTVAKINFDYRIFSRVWQMPCALLPACLGQGTRRASGSLCYSSKINFNRAGQVSAHEENAMRFPFLKSDEMSPEQAALAQRYRASWRNKLPADAEGALGGPLDAM